MKTATQYLDEIRLAHPKADGTPATNYRLGKLLKASDPTIIRYTKHGGTFDDEIAMRVAALLNIEPDTVIADMDAQRAQGTKSAAIRARIAKAVASASVAGIIMLIAGVTLPESGMLGNVRAEPVQFIHYTK